MCNVVPRLKTKILFQLFLKSIRILPLVSVGLTLLPVYRYFFTTELSVFSKKFANAFISPSI